MEWDFSIWLKLPGTFALRKGIFGYLMAAIWKKTTTKKMNKSPMRLAPNLNFCSVGFIAMKSLKRIIE